VNLYAYVGNNPIWFTDVFGLAAKAFVKAYDDYLDIKKSVYWVLPWSYDLTFVNLSEKEKQEWLSELNAKRDRARNLHYKRNDLNTWLPSNIQEATRMWYSETVFNTYHQEGVPDGQRNQKWVGPQWNKEIIFSYIDWSVVTDLNNEWTYNFYPWSFWTSWKHKKYDVDPWKEWWSWWNDTHSMR